MAVPGSTYVSPEIVTFDDSDYRMSSGGGL